MVIVSVELRNFLICGLFGNFRKTKEINGHRLSALQDLVAINEKVYLPAVLLFAQIRSDYPVSVLKRLFQTLQKAPFFMFPVQIY